MGKGVDINTERHRCHSEIIFFVSTTWFVMVQFRLLAGPIQSRAHDDVVITLAVLGSGGEGRVRAPGLGKICRVLIDRSVQGNLRPEDRIRKLSSGTGGGSGLEQMRSDCIRPSEKLCLHRKGRNENYDLI
jgi:hypothetical protein